MTKIQNSKKPPLTVYIRRKFMYRARPGNLDMSDRPCTHGNGVLRKPNPFFKMNLTPYFHVLVIEYWSLVFTCPVK